MLFRRGTDQRELCLLGLQRSTETQSQAHARSDRFDCHVPVHRRAVHLVARDAQRSSGVAGDNDAWGGVYGRHAGIVLGRGDASSVMGPSYFARRDWLRFDARQRRYYRSSLLQHRQELSHGAWRGRWYCESLGWSVWRNPHPTVCWLHWEARQFEGHSEFCAHDGGSGDVRCTGALGLRCSPQAEGSRGGPHVGKAWVLLCRRTVHGAKNP